MTSTPSLPPGGPFLDRQRAWTNWGASGDSAPLERPPGPSIDLSLADGYVRCNYCHEVVTVDRWPQTTIALCAWVGDYYARHQFCADLMEEA